MLVGKVLAKLFTGNCQLTTAMGPEVAPAPPQNGGDWADLSGAVGQGPPRARGRGGLMWPVLLPSPRELIYVPAPSVECGLNLPGAVTQVSPV